MHEPGPIESAEFKPSTDLFEVPVTHPGAAPGTLVVQADSAKPLVSVIAYGPEAMAEFTVRNLDELEDLHERWPVVWVNVDGFGDLEVLRRIGEIFAIHRLALEDVVSVFQRAKVEEYDEHFFIVVRMPSPGDSFETEQVSMFLADGVLLTFQDRPGDVFDGVRGRIRSARGRIRRAGADYLAYALIDAVVDSYFPVMERCGERIDAIEEEILSDPGTDTITRLHEVKRDLLALRRVVWPMRDTVNALVRDETPLVQEETRIHLRDCYDHTIQLMDIVESYRELGAALMDFYMTNVSNRMNEVMKVLTIIATIFIPLSFIASVYGMNFDSTASSWNMPELRWKYGYPFVVALMLAVGIGLLWFFRRKRWI